MKNKYFSFVALAAAALATSCASDDLAEQKQEQTGTRTVTLTASVNDVQTRVGMSKENSTTASFYWHSSDKILVQTKSSESSYSGAEFSIKDDDAKKDGATSATFTGEVTGTVGTYAVYPYNESHSFTGETALTYNLPASYTYTSVESNIFSKTTDGTTAYPSNPTNMPMLGTITDGKISFKCLGGLAVIRIDQMPAAEGTLTVTADQQLSGSFEVDLSADEAKLATTSTDVNDADKKVTFNFSGATAKGVGVFYLPLATGSYTNVKVTIKDSSSETWRTFNYSGTLSITRAGVTAVPIVSANMGTIVKNDNGTYTINNKYEFVDLGLSVLWATVNVGATAVSDYGDFYSWGETTTKTSYTNNNYTYKDQPTTLPAANDAATVNWGAPCRMPTQAEFTALKDNCTWKWTYEEVSATGTSLTFTFGWRATGNGKSIFLPASGYKTGTSVTGQGQSGGQGLYWSSSFGVTNTSSAYLLKFTNTELSCPVAECYTGCTVRAVVDKP